MSICYICVSIYGLIHKEVPTLYFKCTDIDPFDIILSSWTWNIKKTFVLVHNTFPHSHLCHGHMAMCVHYADFNFDLQFSCIFSS